MKERRKEKWKRKDEAAQDKGKAGDEIYKKKKIQLEKDKAEKTD